MYTQFFHLQARPFSISPDPRYLFMSERHQEALAHLLYGLNDGGGFVALTGEVGTGKTTLCHYVLSQLPENVELALILNPRLSAVELLATLCDELGVGYPDGTTSVKALVDALNRHLLAVHASGRKTVVMIDEAQNLSFDVLEQVRLLTNLETSQTKLLQMILVGQPELNRMLEQKNLRQLLQRITARYHLQALDLDETRQYIRHRLRVSGGDHSLFTAAAEKKIYRHSRGVPRLINMICDRAMMGAYSQNQDVVSRQHVSRAVWELFPVFRSGGAWAGRWRLGAIMACVFGLSVLLAVRYDVLTWSLTASDESGGKGSMKASPVDVAPVVFAETVSGANVSPAVEVPKVVPFESLLKDSSQSFGEAVYRLYLRWGIDASASPQAIEECQDKQIVGSHGCLIMNSSWQVLRKFNRPAVMEFSQEGQGARYLVLVAMDGNQPLLQAADGKLVRTDLGQMLALWEGNYLIVWKRPAPGRHFLVEGGRGPEVIWLRSKLARYDKRPVSAEFSDLFDAGLAAEVKAYQNHHGLEPDGIVGPKTMIHLNNVEPGSDIQLLVETKVN